MPERSREEAVLLLCARRSLSPEAAARLHDLLSASLEWQRFFEVGAHHAVLRLAASHLRSADSVPPAVRDRLQGLLIENTALNLRRTTQLAAVLESFRHHGIPAAAWKGPALAASAYGHVGLRTFVDLDILVGRHIIRSVVGVMRAAGYTTYAPTAHAFRGPVPQSWREYKFIPDDHRLATVEVHASGAPWAFAVRLDTQQAIERAIPVIVGGVPIAALAAEDMLLHLAIHGADHSWSQLRMVADVDAAASAPVDWAVVEARASDARIGRMLAVALLLARDLLETPLPDAVIAVARGDRTAAQLAREFAQRLFSPVHPLLMHAWRDRSSWRVREHASDRLRYVARLMIFDFGVKQWDWVRRKVAGGVPITTP